MGSEWEERVVAELDSSLNRWQELLPAHCEFTKKLFAPSLTNTNMLTASEMGPKSNRRALLFPGRTFSLHVLPCTDVYPPSLHLHHGQTNTHTPRRSLHFYHTEQCKVLRANPHPYTRTQYTVIRIRPSLRGSFKLCRPVSYHSQQLRCPPSRQ